jgi:hypothetical protein
MTEPINDYKYWTGLKRTKKNLTWDYEFSDGTCTNFAKEKFNVEHRCFYIKNDPHHNHGWHLCTNSNYFICQVNKGNKIYR